MTSMLQSGCRRRTWSAAVMPAMPLPITTTFSISRLNLKPAIMLDVSSSGRSGLSATDTGPTPPRGTRGDGGTRRNADEVERDHRGGLRRELSLAHPRTDDPERRQREDEATDDPDELVGDRDADGVVPAVGQLWHVVEVVD